MGKLINDRLHNMAANYCQNATDTLKNSSRGIQNRMGTSTQSSNNLMRESQERIQKVESLYSPLLQNMKQYTMHSESKPSHIERASSCDREQH